jgi:hypothetical protein
LYRVITWVGGLAERKEGVARLEFRQATNPPRPAGGLA